jgi:hypothetical protein
MTRSGTRGNGALVWLFALPVLIALAIGGPAAARTVTRYNYVDVKTVLVGDFYRPSEAAQAGAQWYKLQMKHCPVHILYQTFVVDSGGYSFAMTYVPSKRCA